MATTDPRNPFGPAQSAVDTFVGRDLLLNELVAGLKEGKSYELIGPPGIGKTTLLGKLQRLILSDPKRRQLSPVPVVLRLECARNQEGVGVVLANITNALIRGVSEDCGCSFPPDQVTEAQGAAKSGNLAESLDLVFQWAFKTANRSYRAVLLLDALHRISDRKVLVQLCDKLKKLVDRKTVNVLLVGRQHLAQRVPDPLVTSYLLHQLTGFKELGPLNETETQALIACAGKLGWSVENGCAVLAYQKTKGHPYRLQYYLHESLATHGEITSKSLLDVCTPSAEAKLDSILNRPENGDDHSDGSAPRRAGRRKKKARAGKLPPTSGLSAKASLEPAALAAAGELADFLANVRRIYMKEHVVAGKYVRYETQVVEHLKREADRVISACTTPSPDPENFFVWGYPEAVPLPVEMREAVHGMC